MNNSFIDAVQARRSIYALDKNVSKSDSEIQTIVEQAMAQAPSAFGAQPTRTLVLFNRHHDKLWDIVEKQLKAIVPADKFEPTAQKIASFRAGYGTILYFEDQDVIKGMQDKFPLYADNFPVWGMQAQGIALFSIWSALAAGGIGASIQHYNPLIDNDVKAEWQIPASWTLLGQMPFGNVAAPAAARQPVDISTLVKIFK
jgi:predicted oxidoreductase (fatty acid repression mutant protein)